MGPQVSIIIPVYNHQNYIEQALRSVFEQSYQNIEVIIIDDGSTDQSVEQVEACIRAYPGKNIQFLRQENRGAHHTINRGLSMASGEYLTILNSDDYYSLDRIEKMLRFIQETKAEIVFSYLTWVDGKSEPLPVTHGGRVWYDQQIFREIAIQPSIGFALLSGNIAVTTGNLFFTKKLYQLIGGFRDFKIAHDLDFLMRALPDFEPAMLRESLLFYRMHDSNTVTKHAAKTGQELAQIYGEYLLRVESSEPKNSIAPSRKRWPNFLSHFGINSFIHLFLQNIFIRDVSEKSQSAVELRSTCNEVILKPGAKYTLISHEMGLSGAPKLIADLAISIKNQGASVNVLTLANGPMAEVLKKHGIEVKVIPQKFSQWIHSADKYKKNIRLMLLFLFLAFNTRGKILINSAASWPIFPAMIHLRRFKRVALYIHESVSPYGLIPYGFMTEIFQKISHDKLFDFWFGSAATGQIWKQVGFPGKVVYWSGLESPKSETQVEEKPIKKILTVGSANSRKGTHYLIDAFISLAKSGRIPNDVQLTIVGFSDGIDAFMLDTLLAVLLSGFKDRIHLVSNVAPESLEKYFKDADLYVQPSIMECLPISLLQAMSLGIPVVTTDVDGCSEAIQHEKNGYLCKSQNVESLAAAIERAVNHSKEANGFAKKAKTDFQEKFSLSATEGKMLKALADL